MGFWNATVSEPVRKEQRLDFWRKEEPEVDDGGLVTKGGLWVPQRRWWNLDNFIRVLVGGYGSGKTLAGCKRVISLALTNAPAPVATVSPTFPVGRETVIATIAELLDAKQRLIGKKRFKWWYDRTHHIFRIHYRGKKARIICYSGDDPDALRGPNLAAAYIDEPFIQKADVFKQILARVRHPRATLREINLTGTPEQLNWGYDLCIGEWETALDVGYVQAHTLDNRALPKDYTQRLSAALSKKEAEAYLAGEFVNLSSGLVFHAFSNADNTTKGVIPAKFKQWKTKTLKGERGDGEKLEIQIPFGAELGAGMDFNVDPMACVVFWTLGDHVHVFDEIELPNSDTEEMCSELRMRYGLNLREVYPDPSGKQRRTNSPGGKTDFHYIEEAGYNVRAPHEPYVRRDSFNAVNGKLKNRNEQVTITIDKVQCPKLVKYLSVYAWSEMNKQKEMSHLLDAFRYPITWLYPVVRETPVVTKLKGH